MYFNRDEGTVSNIIFSNILVDCMFYSDVWWGKAEPIYVTSYPRAVGNHKDAGWRFPKGATKGHSGEVSNIFFNQIKCTSENGIFVGGDTPEKVHHIYFDEIDVKLLKRTGYESGVYDKRPCNGDGFVYDKTYAFYLDTASDIRITGYNIYWAFPQLTQAGGEIKKKNTIRVKINKK